eukprot:TRINITY_DN6763_c0_g1_i5.p1 TRINITY_DN6763_c0_g1~~TRINITY_DN6763_c0_g1_i5.p1  ORF type:complete len:192 (+),score=25.14 TRINITY_DN6763_c0_g1_i5:91-666(+)
MNDSCKLSFAYPFGNSNSRQLRKFMAKNYIAARGSFSSTHWITESYSPQHMEHLVSSLLVTGNVQFMTPAVQAAVNQGCGWLIFNGHGLDRCGSDDGCGCQTGWEPLNYDMFETHLHTIATLVQLCGVGRVSFWTSLEKKGVRYEPQLPAVFRARAAARRSHAGRWARAASSMSFSMALICWRARRAASWS